MRAASKKVMSALKNDLMAAFCGELTEAEHFCIRRDEPDKITSVKVKTTHKVDAYKHDIVFVPALTKIIREVCDCHLIPFNRAGLSLKAGMSIAWIYSNNVKAGICYYGTYQKVHKVLEPYQKLLKSWKEFSDVRLIERNTIEYREETYRNLARSGLKKYNAGSRKVKLAHVDSGDVITFFDKSEGVYMHRAAIPEADVDVTVHNLGRGITIEPTQPLKRDLVACIEDSLTHRGMRYAVADKEELQ